jgi:hypothetical protein
MDLGSKHVFAETDGGEVINDLDHLIWQVWYELDGQVSRARIRQVAMQVAAAFRDAPVTTHIPLWIRHLTREWLKAAIKRHNLNALDRASCLACPGLPILIRGSLWSSLTMMHSILCLDSEDGTQKVSRLQTARQR